MGTNGDVAEPDATGCPKASVREVMELPRARERVGFPPSTATDAQRGYSATAHQSAEIPLWPCHGAGSVSVRIGGSPARAYYGPKSELTQQGKVGNSRVAARLHILR